MKNDGHLPLCPFCRDISIEGTLILAVIASTSSSGLV